MSSLIPFAVAIAGGLMMALALPKTNCFAVAPLGAAACFWSWYGLPPRRAFFAGWLAGIAYFALAFAWFGETAGRLIAPFGFVITLGPAIADGFLNFALAGLGVAVLARHARREVLPLGAAAVFALCEWLRAAGVGPIDVPFATLGLGQIAGPLAPLAAYVGEFGVTFVVALIGAHLALVVRAPGVRSYVKICALVFLGIGAVTGYAWNDWPARSAGIPYIRVAAVQGNIAQSVKTTSASIAAAIERYPRLTTSVAGARPALVLWPETVIPVDFTRSPKLAAQFAMLARTMGTELVVGTLQATRDRDYNALYFFRPDGAIDTVYRKRELVPFAEALPFAGLSVLPYASLISHFSRGETDGITTISIRNAFRAQTIRVAPLICWESAFGDHAQHDVAAGADVLLVATDDAWFGTTAGPYQHAAIAQLRAIETGRWVVRAAATGISGIIAPDGHYTASTEIGVATTVTGAVGDPVTTTYDRIGGSTPVAIGFALLAIAALASRRLRGA